MIDQTKIEWTDFTVNFWEGCQKVGPGCDHCYAEARDVRFTGGSHWGPGAPRRKVKGGIAKLQKINREAGHFHEKHGRWPRVFCSSLSDVFDNAVDRTWRDEALMEIDCAGFTKIQLLTKRIGNVEKMIPDVWHTDWPPHVGLLITVVNQAEADRDIPKLLAQKAKFGIPWVGLSVEPMLGAVDLTRIDMGTGPITGLEHQGIENVNFKINALTGVRSFGWSGVDWVIAGGESGRGARAMHPDFARDLQRQCEEAGTAFLFKQWGEWAPAEPSLLLRSLATMPGQNADVWAWPDGTKDGWRTGAMSQRVGKKVAGRKLDGREHNGFLDALLC